MIVAFLVVVIKLTTYFLLHQFLMEQRFRGNSDVTVNWYNNQISLFLVWLGVSDVSALDLDHYKNYAIYLCNYIKRDGGYLSSASINTAMRAIKVFYNYVISCGYIPDFSRDLKLPKLRIREKLVLDDAEYRAVYDYINRYDNVIDLRNNCFIALMLDSGLRRGEIPRINVGDVNFRNDTVLIRGKGSKQRLVPLGKTSHSLLYSYISRFNRYNLPNYPFFVDRSGQRCSDNLVKLVCHRLKQSIGIDRLHPHLLRHTFATYYLADGGDLETLRLILGHSNIQTTQRYLHLAFNLKLQCSRHISHLDFVSGDKL